MLIAFSGLPATGKSTIARALALRLSAVHVRVDTIEQSIVDSGIAVHPIGPVGYVVAYRVAADQLRNGLTVIADSVKSIVDYSRFLASDCRRMWCRLRRCGNCLHEYRRAPQ